MGDAKSEHLDMRILMAVVTALLALSVLAEDVHAQGMGSMGGGRGQRQADPPPNSKDKPAKADEKAYQDALKRIPEKKTDPWGSMR
jgi:hypothetical protein